MSSYLEQLQLISLANTNYREIIAQESDGKDEEFWRNTIVHTVAIPDMDHIQLRNQYFSLADTKGKGEKGRYANKCAMCPDGSISEGFRKQVASQVRGSQLYSATDKRVSNGSRHSRRHKRRQKRDRFGKQDDPDINDNRGGGVDFKGTSSMERGDDSGDVLSAIKQLEDFLRCR